MIRLIVGPPGAGKSTLVQREQGPGDLVIDLDRIRETVPNEATARKLRTLLEEKATEHEDGDVWIIRTLADPKAREEFAARVGVDETRILDTPAEVAKARVKERDGNEEKFPAIDRWWADYVPDKGAEGEDDMSRTEQEATAEGVQEAAETHDEQAGQAASKATPGDGKGWPEDTPVAEMTGEQAAAYWKHHSRRHEQAYKDLREQLQKEQEKDTTPDPGQSAREEARQEIFEARLEAATATLPEGYSDYVETLKQHLDVATFTGQDGKIDPGKVRALFEALPTGNPTPERGLPDDFGSDQAYTGAAGIDIGRELYRAKHGQR